MVSRKVRLGSAPIYAFSVENRAKKYFIFQKCQKGSEKGVRGNRGGGGVKWVGRDTANNFFMDGLMVLRCGLKFRHFFPL